MQLVPERRTHVPGARSLVALLALCALLLGSFGASWHAADAQGGSMLYLPLTYSGRPVPRADSEWVSPFGITLYGGIGTGSGLDQMREAGSTWVSTMLHWSVVQPNSASDWIWTPYDESFAVAQGAGMEVFVLVAGVPSWARGNEPIGGGPGIDTASFVAFVAAAAERYDGDGQGDAPGSPVVKYWSFFAEPDYGLEPPLESDSYKGHWGNNGGEYATLLLRASAAIKAAAPNAVVTNGGLAFDWFTGIDYNPDPVGTNWGRFTRSFIADVIAAGGERGMDVLAIHYFPVTMGSWNDKISALYLTGEEVGVLDQMRSLPLISPEMGYWAYCLTQSGAECDRETAEREQSIHLVHRFVRGLASGVSRMAWLSVFDGGTRTDSFGLFRGGDLSQPRPAYWAYKTLAFELHGFRYDGPAHSETPPNPVTSWVYEAYRFRRAADGSQLLVAWANPRPPDFIGSEPLMQIQVPAAQVTVVSLLGLNERSPYVPEAQVISDGGAGDLDGSVGRISLTLTKDPIYIWVR